MLSLARKMCALASGAAAAALLVTAPVADARDTLHKFPLEAAMAKAQASAGQRPVPHSPRSAA